MTHWKFLVSEGWIMLRHCIAVLALASIATVASADITSEFDNETDFLAALETSFTENFNGNPGALPSPQTFTLGPFELEASTFLGGNFITQGGVQLGPNEGGETIIFDLTADPILAVGGEFSLLDPDFFFTDGNIQFIFSDGSSSQVAMSSTGPTYAGFIFDQPITSFRYFGSGDLLGAFVDDLTVGIPEPGSMALVGVAACGCLLTRVLRRRSV